MYITCLIAGLFVLGILFMLRDFQDTGREIDEDRN